MLEDDEEQGLMSTRPYLIRAIYEWCSDQGFTPYLLVHVDEQVRVPMEHVRNQEIVLNVSMDATGGLQLGNEWIEFKARFSGKVREILVPVDHVKAIYARENGEGMSFPPPLKRSPTAKPLQVPASSPLQSVPVLDADVTQPSDSSLERVEAQTVSAAQPGLKLVTPEPQAKADTHIALAIAQTEDDDGAPPPEPPTPNSPSSHAAKTGKPSLKLVK